MDQAYDTSLEKNKPRLSSAQSGMDRIDFPTFQLFGDLPEKADQLKDASDKLKT